MGYSKAAIASLLVLAAIFVQLTMSKECIKTKVGRPCKEDTDCHSESELNLYCNKSRGANVCTFRTHTYIGHAATNLACEGPEYSAESWTNPLPAGAAIRGIDCMRLCLHTQTCFGIGIYNKRCYLKNEKCFTHLKKKKGAYIAVLNVVREDYRCGCHYPFTRLTSTKQTLTWSPDCPETQLTRNPYRCCSERGLCTKCPGEGAANASAAEDFDFVSRYRFK